MLDDDGAPIQVLEYGRAAAILFVGSTTEPGPGATLLASEPGVPPAAVAGTVLDTLPFPELEELTTANRRKDEFLAMLGHELRSPLAAIQKAVRLLRVPASGGEVSLRFVCRGKPSKTTNRSAGT